MSWKTTTYSGWGRVLHSNGRLARPERASALGDIVGHSPAPAIGNCRSYGDACLNSDGDAVLMTRLDRVLAFDDANGLLKVEAGASIGDLGRLFAPRGWMMPVMPGTGFATVGGGIAMDVHGKNHHHAGSFGQHVRELTLFTFTGRKTITPDGDPDLFRATIGGLGQTGPILDATLQLTRAKGDVIVVTERRIASLDDFVDHFKESDATYSVGWIDATATGSSVGRGILEEAETGSGLVKASSKSKRVPFDAPAATLSSGVVRAFNAAYWRRVPAKGRTVVKPIDAFFFPLDKIHYWNRLYGKTGFHQFQCVVPPDAVEALRGMLEKIGQSSLASPLAVLKRLGPGRGGFMSFPMEGWTLAVDFPNRNKVGDLIKTLETMTAEANGRIYLAKDALASGQTIRDMYPEREAWLAEVDKADPEGAFETDLVRRLNLRAHG